DRGASLRSTGARNRMSALTSDENAPNASGNINTRPIIISAAPTTEYNVGSQPRIAANMTPRPAAVAAAPALTINVDTPSSSSANTSRIASSGDKWLAFHDGSAA